MEYQDVINEVQNLGFIKDQNMADAATKAVLGILASAVEKRYAQILTANLPDPLTFEKLRGQQRQIVKLSIDSYLTELGNQFKISKEQAAELVNTVLHIAKEAIPREDLAQLRESLPPDVSTLLHEA
ncbi:MAG: DUF2267 domain-containing protein [bacterium]